GTTTFNEMTGLTRVMAEVAREVVVMIESEKIGRRIPNLELAWSSIDTLITDNALDEDTRRAIEQTGTDVICVDNV
ncbi:XRE family transcriptional regulator, partial [Salinivibrio sp. IB574]